MLPDEIFLARARENGPELYTVLSKCFRAYKQRVPVGSDAMIAVMKALDKVDGQNRYKSAVAEQNARRANAEESQPANHRQ